MSYTGHGYKILFCRWCWQYLLTKPTPVNSMLRIIIADDHPVIRQGLKELLLEEFSPVHVEEAEDTTSLIEKGTNGSWDLVISDLAMPGGGGIVALKKIKQAQKDLPVVIISTYPSEQYGPKVIKAGAEAFVSKDALPNGLIAAIQKVLDERKVH